ncbi:MAG: hypothetical protein C5S49_01720 [Candidatus Methanogaster sp.]|nr:MAG: hypothetical protein C5S49_01720 [ANME-2 cluster archaeon]
MITGSHASSPMILGSHASSPMILGSHASSPMITFSFASSPMITGSHASSPMILGSHASSPMILGSHASSPMITFSFATSDVSVVPTAPIDATGNIITATSISTIILIFISHFLKKVKDMACTISFNAFSYTACGTSLAVHSRQPACMADRNCMALPLYHVPRYSLHRSR